MKIRLVICVVSAISLASFVTARGIPEKLSPVIFVPGDGGSQVEAKLNKPNVVHYICQKQSDWFNIWLNMELLVPVVIDCFIDNMRLVYDNVTRKSYNPPGVEVRMPGWGNPEVVEWIDPSHSSTGKYFQDISQALIPLGYERMKSIRGAPYDFRKAPNENKQWFSDMKDLIEDTYTLNNDTAVTIISHSMGSPMTMVLLQQLPDEWKNKYIRRVISLAGAWAGSIKAVKVFAMGDDLGSFALSGKTLRPLQISYPSMSWLLPSPLFWKPNEVLVETPDRQYTMAQLKEFLADLDYTTGWEMRKDTITYSLNFSPLNVEVHCLYGTGLDTVEKLRYKKSVSVSEKPTLVMGDGDGTVNSRSLQSCKYWEQFQTQKIYSKGFDKAEHMGILTNADVIKYIVDVLSMET